MKNRKPEMLIPLLYISIIIFMNILAVVLDTVIEISDPMMKMIRLNSLINIGFYGSLFILYIWLFIPAWKQTFIHFVKTIQHQIITVVIGLFSMFLAMIGMGYLYIIMGITSSPENQDILEAQLNGPAFDKVILIVFAVLLAPVVEESLFRLAGFRLLKKIPRIPMWAVILITSLVFGGIHVLGDDLIQILYYAALGAVLGVVYYKSNNIIAPILVHMIFNGFVTLTMFIGI